MRGKQFLKDLRNDCEGNFGPIGAIGLLVAAALVGGGVDMSRMYMVKNRLQAACDAGALAGRRSVTTGGFTTAAQNVANSYFSANFNQAMSNTGSTSYSYTSQDNGNTVDGSVSTTVASTVMSIFGYNNFSLSTTCSATMAMGNSDVTFVLDTTGSMSQTAGSTGVSKISGLKTAMKNFYDTVAAATASSNARIRYAFVPYTSGVNVGNLIYALNPAYLRDSWAVQSREPIYNSQQVQVFDRWADPVNSTAPDSFSSISANYTQGSTQYGSSSSCNSALPSNSAWTDTGAPWSTTSTVINSNGQQVTTTTTNQNQTATLYKCQRSGTKYYIYTASGATRTKYSYAYATQDAIYRTELQNVFAGFTYKQVTYDVSSYKAGGTLTYLNNSGNPVTTTWDGCIEERQTVVSPTFSFSSLTGISPTGAYDLDIDTAPTSDNATKWAPAIKAVAYIRGYSSGWNFVPQNVDTYTSGTNSVNYSCPAAARALASMTQSEFYAYANSLVAGGNTFHDIGAIWGGRLSSPDGIFGSLVNDPPANGGRVARHLIFMTDGEMNADNLTYSTYGIEFHDKRATNDGGSNNDAVHSSRFVAVCQAIKAKGIRLWVISYGTALTSELQSCASDQSAFMAADSNEINTQFQVIASQVGQLRVTQ